MLKYLIAFLVAIGPVIATATPAYGFKCETDPNNPHEYHCAYQQGYETKVSTSNQGFYCTIFANEDDEVNLFSNVDLVANQKWVVMRVGNINLVYFTPDFSQGSIYVDLYLTSTSTHDLKPVVQCSPTTPAIEQTRTDAG